MRISSSAVIEVVVHSLVVLANGPYWLQNEDDTHLIIGRSLSLVGPVSALGAVENAGALGSVSDDVGYGVKKAWRERNE